MDFLAEYDEKIARLRQQLGAGDGGELARELARAHAEKAELVHGFGHLAAAAGEYERAIALFPRHPDGAIELARARANYGSALRDLGRAAEALDQHDQALAILEPAVAQGHREAARDLGMARMDRGFDLDALGLAPQALAEYDRAVALLEGLVRDGGDDELAGDLAAASMTRGDALRRLDRAAEAEPDYQRAIELYLRLGDEAATDLPRARAEKGRLLLTLGRWAEAAAEHEAAIALLEPQVELERQTNDVLRKLGGECRADTEDAQAVARMDRGDALKGLGRLGDAVAEYERAIAAWERLVREGIAGLADRLGAAVATGFEAHCQLRRWADAAAGLRRGLAAAPGGDRPPEPVVEALRALSGEDRAAVEAHLGDVAPRVSGWLAGL